MKKSFMPHISRRDFVKSTLATGGSLILPSENLHHAPPPYRANLHNLDQAFAVIKSLDLSPASWVWLPSQRCLTNTVIFFRKEIKLHAKPLKATGWILGESRYKLYVNGTRIQFGPAPSDPRWAEADPVDIGDRLTSGNNTIGAEVLYYGHGDGTWPIGKPGFIFKLSIEFPDGLTQEIISDSSWRCSVARSWKPGQFKRWYLRSLQEEFDARKYPYGWNEAGYLVDNRWRNAEILRGASNKPVVSVAFRDYLFDSQGVPEKTALRARSITMPKEVLIPVKKLTKSQWLRWDHDPQEYFEFVTPEAFEVVRESLVRASGDSQWNLLLKEDQAALLTFEFAEQIVGFPYFSIEAPQDTVIELLVHEAHEAGNDTLINTHFHSWTRFVCRAGINHFETFDYESLRWMQLHVRNASGSITIKDVGVRRRLFNWQNVPVVRCSDPAIQKVIDASINTLYNCAIETIVDGMGRERQQYSGDVGHVLHCVFHTMGEPTIASRFINTFSQGMTNAGYFLDCWPAFDRLARLMEREMQLTEWGPLLDHGIGFNFDAHHYYMYTGEVDSIREVFPRLVRFFNYLLSIKDADGLLPVENIGVPTVWIDHNAYDKQRHKQCAFNLYAAAMMTHALAPLCDAFGDHAISQAVKAEGNTVLEATIQKFWSAELQTFVINLPWIKEEKAARFCDRSLATSLLYDQCPGNQTKESLNLLINPAENVGMSYPANTGWRYWALTKFNRADVFIKEVRENWSKMDSVGLNNTLSEDWNAKPDANAQWSHCALSPLYGMHMCVAGIKPIEPGFARVLIAPQLGDLNHLEVTSYTVKGPIHLKIAKAKKMLLVEVTIPQSVKAIFEMRGKDYPVKEGRNVLKISV